jgi:outer membrane protein OmpA-like peptidoglycan-associated protein
MELIMKINRYLPPSLITAAILASCGTAPPQDSTLAEAHALYSNAQTNPDVVNLAPIELKEAGESLGKADAASSKGESDAAVHHAYLAKQQVAIAEETAKRKTAELEITNASAQRDQIRLAARTAEAETARRQAETAQQLVEQQEIQLKELEAKKTDRGLVITLGDVLFSVNKAELSPGGTRSVRKLADFLNQYPQRKVLIEGHTDSTGSHTLNQALSERRADAVRTALIDMGVSSDRIETRGHAEAYPVATNGTAAGRQLNRRVEIILADDSGNIVPR